ncbi:MAG: site-specific DNA-methyltransferase [Candidatus Lokiarchaeota archaeon]|nr:site-specific DNA-methyltransferase [Candidatus Lokiarchaeota archaeon]
MALFEIEKRDYLTLREASIWASEYLKREITVSNISYLVQYGRINKYGTNGNPLIQIKELKDYYDAYDRERHCRQKLGDDLNWHLSFHEYRESERTKHVHRLHPYKGKFIPQLVEYFLDSHIDEFKTQTYFRPGDIVLDPFCGSGTTLVQANELGMHALGIDVSAFNAMISNAKIEKHNISEIREAISKITISLESYQKSKNNIAFEERLLSELGKFNAEYFPSPGYKRKVSRGEINEREYAGKKEQEFLPIYYSLIKKFNIQILQNSNGNFLDRWFLLPVREEIDFVFNELRKIDNSDIRKILAIILSRTVRSCRATTHADLATLKEPVKSTYYCKKHGKVCKPIFTIKGWWQRYSIDTLNRLKEFDRLRTGTYQICLSGDSRTIDLVDELGKRDTNFASLVKANKIQGIFSSPPYVGLIDYHEQHAYAYEIFGFDRKDELEIGPLFKGQGKEARESYSRGIADVLSNCKRFLTKDFEVFLVANDKYNLYPHIANLAGMKIINKFKRPVLNRVEKDRSNAYSEIIFHLKDIHSDSGY